MSALAERQLARLHEEAKADRWGLQAARFSQALEASAERAFRGKRPQPHEIDRYLSSLHLEDLALACACAEGSTSAWDHFVLHYRPVLYRSAEAIDATGAARELADSLYADLYGLEEESDERRSLLRYFHGRSSLATWLRSVLAQRWVDLVRSRKRFEPLPDDLPALLAGGMPIPNPDAPRYATMMQDALAAAVQQLPFKEAFRLRTYYEQQLTLAQIGRLLREHEATVSRQLERTRRAIREHVRESLTRRGLSAVEVQECFEAIGQNSGTMDLARMFGEAGLRKIPKPDRSQEDM